MYQRLANEWEKVFLMNEVRPFQLASCITHANHEYFVPKNSDHVALWHTAVVTIYIYIYWDSKLLAPTEPVRK